jgi:hypothetical protein
MLALYHSLPYRRFYMSHLTESCTPDPHLCLRLSFLIRGARRPSLEVYFGRKKLPPPLNGDVILVPPGIFNNPHGQVVKGFQPNCVAQSSYRAAYEGIPTRRRHLRPFSMGVSRPLQTTLRNMRPLSCNSSPSLSV